MTEDQPRPAGACTLKTLGGREYYCTIELCLQVIGGKWKPIILWRLHMEGVRRFGELKKAMPNITQKMLTQQLRELEADGMVSRHVHAEVPPRVEYALTALGESVIPILERMCAWGREFERRAAPGGCAVGF
ncbi:MAG: winged helix-turn-helix transcriptional regulator [Thermodesulfobacteriota bacterium]|nr:helix-turn-helix transcriptional regulator [Desulfovibrio sp.]